ncbi:carboxymuconolactone decarboxylase family protein [Pseudomonas sp. PDM31]|jgi:alkylhydroperoxidase/carboxymuconolactone decarboxylase family protein YurZ|uniref:carboxymuconolactone decarboxylase family protein n=1 Tax=Pseudomonas sp. PDM31 TaxID=2854778 RepID=UPI001C467105|nr:carboxymuconolactone decarboxylase family protein [Pseudomonas sp. PDM31]MBV7476288.1 carboxymuconolactone decarboxylase family protein [Pseudomonas sp. PDM31]
MPLNQPKPTTPTCDAMREAGNWNPAWSTMAELDAEWIEKFLSMAVHPMHKEVLDPKTVELISIAVDASCTHLYAPGVRRHIRKALELGVSVEEVLAVLQLTSVLGIHSMAVGAPLLIEEAQKLAAEGPRQGSY